MVSLLVSHLTGAKINPKIPYSPMESFIFSRLVSHERVSLSCQSFYFPVMMSSPSTFPLFP